jgi:hypothetical protein
MYTPLLRDLGVAASQFCAARGPSSGYWGWEPDVVAVGDDYVIEVVEQ